MHVREREMGGGDWNSSNWVRGCAFAWDMYSAVVLYAHTVLLHVEFLVPKSLQS